MFLKELKCHLDLTSESSDIGSEEYKPVGTHDQTLGKDNRGPRHQALLYCSILCFTVRGLPCENCLC